jgi:hypothetical protein
MDEAPDQGPGSVTDVRKGELNRRIPTLERAGRRSPRNKASMSRATAEMRWAWVLSCVLHASLVVVRRPHSCQYEELAGKCSRPLLRPTARVTGLQGQVPQDFGLVPARPALRPTSVGKMRGIRGDIEWSNSCLLPQGSVRKTKFPTDPAVP